MKVNSDDVKMKVVNTCTDIIERKINLIVGCRILASLRYDVGEFDEEMFTLFQAVDSETDYFPLGEIRVRCSETYLRNMDVEISAYIEDVKSNVYDTCKNLIERYSWPQ